MVSGFLISPYDQDRIFSGLAIEILIWSNTCAGTRGLKRFMISWFIVFSSTPLEQSAPRVVKFPPLFPPHRGGFRERATRLPPPGPHYGPTSPARGGGERSCLLGCLGRALRPRLLR